MTPGLKYIADTSKRWSLEAAAMEAELSAWRELGKRLHYSPEGSKDQNTAKLDLLRMVKGGKE